MLRRCAGAEQLADLLEECLPTPGSYDGAPLAAGDAALHQQDQSVDCVQLYGGVYPDRFGMVALRPADVRLPSLPHRDRPQEGMGPHDGG